MPVRRTHPFIRAAGAAALAALACAWVVGRVCSDRFAWSQPVSWVPPAMLAGPVWLAALAGLIIGPPRRAGRGSAGPRRRGFIRGCALAFAAVSFAHFAFMELGLHRLLLRPDAGGGTALRLAFWNQAGFEVADPAAAYLASDPDLFVSANRNSDTEREEVVRAMLAGGGSDDVRAWPFDLFSRLPITSWGSTSLGLEGRSRRVDGSMQNDTGWAAWFEVRADAGPLIIWAIDLPSDPSLGRFGLARRAGEAVASWRGAVHASAGRAVVRAETAGFPEPDIIVGDFNIPRRAASLEEFLRASGAGPMRNAFDVGGWGWARTWPRENPVWAIDQCFVGERLDATGLRTPDPGLGGHRMLVVDLVLRAPQPPRP